MGDDRESPFELGNPTFADGDGSTDEGRRYWKAAIAHLAPEKREAAWEFYLDRLESSAAADTLGGVMLLLEAHLAFFDDLPARLGQAAQQIDAAFQPLGGAGASPGLSPPTDAPNRAASLVRRRGRLPPALRVGLVALLGGIIGCVGTVGFQRFHFASPLINRRGEAGSVLLTRIQAPMIESWNDPTTGRPKGTVVCFSHVAAVQRTEVGEAKIYLLSPAEEVRENIQALQQLAR